MRANSKIKQAAKRLLEIFRSATQWNSETGMPASGYTAFPHSFQGDVIRLARGKYQVGLILQAWALTCGARQKKEEPVPEISAWQLVSELAEVLGCSEDQVWDDAREAKVRGVLRVEERRGQIRIGCPWQSWEKMKSYVPGPTLVSKKEVQIPTNIKYRDPVVFTPGQRESISFTKPTAGAFFEANLGCSVTIGEGPEGLVIRLGEVKEKVKKTKAVKTSVPEPTPEVTASSRLTFTSPLTAVLADYGILSDLSAQKLIAECQTWAPECSVEEIMDAARVIGEAARQNPKVKSVSGWLISQVPVYFRDAYPKGIKPAEMIAAAAGKKPATSARDQKVYEAMDLFRSVRRGKK